MTKREPKEKEKGGKAKFRYIDPPNVLREKCGHGGIDPVKLDRAEDFIKANPVDFTPHAHEIMARLEKIIADAKAGRLDAKQARDMLTRPIMELKANGGMFKYFLLSEIADIVLNFLETITELNEDAFEIVDAHQNALGVIVSRKLQGGGGNEGRLLVTELAGACQRYYRRHKAKEGG